MKTKKLKVFAMILLTSTLLILASSASVSTVKAATTSSVFLYTTLGAPSSSAVTANGTAMAMGASTSFNTGDTEQFKATAASGFEFLCFVYADASAQVASTNNPYTKTITGNAALEAVFIPTTNTTATASGSGAATLTVFATYGGTTTPAGSNTGKTASGYTIGHSATLTQTPGSDFKFLCWVVQCSSNNYYTSSPLVYTPTEAGAAIEAIWVPTSSSVTLPSASATPTPKVAEFSSAMVAIVALALVASAFGTYAVAKKNRK